MPALPLTVHFALASLWLGCLLTESIIGRTLHRSGPEMRVTTAEALWRVAALFEAPVLLGLLVSGGYALGTPHAGGTAFQVMLSVGLLTIFLAVFKVWLAFKRRAAARHERWGALDKLAALQGLLGMLVRLGVLAALVAGVLAHG